MSIAEKLLAAAENVPLVFESGKAANQAEVDKKIYVGTAYFSDTNSMTVSLPFVPDKMMVFSMAALTMSSPLTYYILTFDRTSFAERCAQMSILDDSLSPYSARILTTSRDKYFKVDENGVTFVPPQSDVWASSLWIGGAPYTVSAYRSGKSDKELLKEQIDVLSEGGGSVTFLQSRVNETVTDEEWATLIATKPNWTINLV